jgi:beta-glucanase (GH16 family)
MSAIPHPLTLTHPRRAVSAAIGALGTAAALALGAVQIAQAAATTHPARRAAAPRARPAATTPSGLTATFPGPAGTSPNPATWSFDTGNNWGTKGELDYYTSSPQNASVDGHGNLVITARRQPATANGITREYSTARIQTYQKFDFTYGQISARIKVPSGAGLWPQFWAVGDSAYSNNNWPASGEIDAMEMVGSDPFNAYGTIHGPDAQSANGYAIQGTYHSATSLAAGFHTYSATWTPSQISFAVDGHTYKTITPAGLPSGASWPFNHPFFVILDLAVGSSWPGAPTAATSFPASMLVNSVKVTPYSATTHAKRQASRAARSRA